MAITIHKGAEAQEIKKSLEELQNQNKQAKEQLIAETFGKISFDSKKSPETIQRAMRDEWS